MRINPSYRGGAGGVQAHYLCPAKVDEDSFPEIRLQHLIDIGINAWAVELLVESVHYALGATGRMMERDLRFTYRGVQISFQRVADDERIARRITEKKDQGRST